MRPRRYFDINNYGEGLHPWQAKKLYFFSDASHQDFLAHHGPAYLATDISSSKHVPFADLNKQAWLLYATQIDPLLDYYVKMPDYLILAKSLVKISSPEADVWDGIDNTPIPFAPAPGYHPSPRSDISLELGGPWAFYQQFQAAHALSTALSFVKPQTAMSSSNSLWVPLILHNDTDQSRDLTLHSNLPDGWTPMPNDVIYHLEAHSTYPAQLFLTRTTPVATPAATGVVAAAPPTQQLSWSLSANGKPIGEVNLTVYLEYNGVPQ